MNMNQTEIIVHETVGAVSLCVNKDMETDTPLKVYLITMNGTAKSECS